MVMVAVVVAVAVVVVGADLPDIAAALVAADLPHVAALDLLLVLLGYTLRRCSSGCISCSNFP